MNIKNTSLFISSFLTLIIALSNFTNAMEGQKPEVSELKNLIDKLKIKETFKIVPSLVWEVSGIGFKNSTTSENLTCIFHDDINQEVIKKFLDFPFQYMQIRLNQLSDNPQKPTLTVKMKYIAKRDAACGEIKYNWNTELLLSTVESISQEDQGFKQFKRKLFDIVKDIEKLLLTKLFSFTDILAQSIHVTGNLENDNEITLYDLTMNLNFVGEPYAVTTFLQALGVPKE